MKCYDAQDRIRLIAGETRSFTLDWSDYLKPGQRLKTNATPTASIEEAGGPSVISALVQKNGSKTRVRLSAGNVAGMYSLSFATDISQRGLSSWRETIRALVRVEDPAVEGEPLEMKLDEDERHYEIPFGNLLAEGERVVGVYDLSINRSSGGAISNATYSNDGQRVSFTVTNPTSRDDYRITATVGVQNQEGTIDTLIVVVGLHVC